MPKGEVHVSAEALLMFLQLDQYGYKPVRMMLEGPQEKLILTVEHPTLPEPKADKLPILKPSYAKRESHRRQYYRLESVEALLYA